MPVQGRHDEKETACAPSPLTLTLSPHAGRGDVMRYALYEQNSNPLPWGEGRVRGFVSVDDGHSRAAPITPRHGWRRPTIHEFFLRETTETRGCSAFAEHDEKNLMPSKRDSRFSTALVRRARISPQVPFFCFALEAEFPRRFVRSGEPRHRTSRSDTNQERRFSDDDDSHDDDSDDDRASWWKRARRYPGGLRRTPPPPRRRPLRGTYGTDRFWH
jgi:hypothetical protein